MFLMIMRKFPFFPHNVFSGVAADQTRNFYTEFDDEFEDIDPPLGQCTVLYNFEGTFGCVACSTRPDPRPFLLKWVALFLSRQQRGHHIHRRGRAAEHHGGGQRRWMDEGPERQRRRGLYTVILRQP